MDRNRKALIIFITFWPCKNLVICGLGNESLLLVVLESMPLKKVFRIGAESL
jgi:hypothetical protein